MDKKKQAYIGLAVAAVMVLGYMGYRYEMSKQPRVVSLEGWDFVFEPGVRVTEQASPAEIGFFIGKDLTTKATDPSINKGDVRVRLLSKYRHPGDLYVRMSEIQHDGCKFTAVKSFLVCSYTTQEQEHTKDLVSIYFTPKGDIYLINDCAVTEGFSPLCGAWGPLGDKYKIAYEYRMGLTKDLTDYDSVARTILQDALKRNAP